MRTNRTDRAEVGNVTFFRHWGSNRVQRILRQFGEVASIGRNATARTASNDPVPSITLVRK